MKILYWRALAGLVILIAVISFLFVFRPNQSEPYFMNMPFALWSGILMTLVLVLITWLGSKIFPYKDEEAS